MLDHLGGVATRRRLEAEGAHPELVTLAWKVGLIRRVRRGLYVSVGTPVLFMRALRVGGQLACVSALEYFGEATEPDHRLHVLVRSNASRLRDADTGAALDRRRGTASDSDIVLHWTRRPIEGGPAIVDRATARRQAAACRALAAAPL